MAVTYHIRIKKEYAVSLIEDLQKADALEVIEAKDDKNFEIQEWQKGRVMARLQEIQDFPEKLVSWKDAEERLRKLKD